MSSKSLKTDAILWVLLMCLAAAAAFVMLYRDSHRRFGAVSYGSFPEFEATTVDSGTFNKHRLKAQVWAVVRTQAAGSETVLKQIFEVQRMTISGKRHMNILTFGADPAVLALPLSKFHIRIPALTPAIEAAFVRAGAKQEGQILLLDQDAIIRGVYDFSSPDDFRSFRQDVTRLL